MDNIVDALFNKYIKNQSNLWEAVRILTSRLTGYELPTCVLKAVLLDAIEGGKTTDYECIQKYLVSSSVSLTARKEEEQEVLHLIHQFTQLMMNYGSRQFARELKQKFPPEHENCVQSCLFIPKNRLYLKNNRTSKRFSLRQGNISIPASNQQLRVSCSESSRDEEVTSSTEGIPIESLDNLERSDVPSAHLNTVGTSSMSQKEEIQSLRSPVKINQVPNLQIVVRGSERSIKSEINKDVNVSLIDTSKASKPEHVTTVSSTVDPPKTTSSDVRNNIQTMSSYLPKESTKTRISACANVASSKPQKTATSKNTNASSINQSSVPKGKGNTSSAKSASTKRSLRTQNVSFVLEEKRFGAAAGMVIKWTQLPNIEVGCKEVFTNLRKLGNEEMIKDYNHLLTAVLGRSHSDVGCFSFVILRSDFSLLLVIFHYALSITFIMK